MIRLKACFQFYCLFVPLMQMTDFFILTINFHSCCFDKGWNILFESLVFILQNDILFEIYIKQTARERERRKKRISLGIQTCTFFHYKTTTRKMSHCWQNDNKTYKNSFEEIKIIEIQRSVLWGSLYSHLCFCLWSW